MILLAAFLAGFAVLAIEIVGVHWMAPWFGASALIWSNQIGVILFAMALGGWLGGRIARRGLSLPLRAGLALLAAALYLKLGEWLLPYFAMAFQEEGMLLEEAAGIFFSGSLAASLFFFAAPVLAASIATPILIQVRSTQTGNAGQAAGEVAAVGTLGSLTGVFAATFFLVPLGVSDTLLAVSLALALAALCLSRQKLVLALVALLGFMSILFSLILPVHGAALPADAKLLESRTSSYQASRVIEFPDATRWLQVNEGLDSFQSVWKEGEVFLGGYYDLFALAPIYAGQSNAEPFRCWLLGAGTGTAVLPLSYVLRPDSDWSVVGVEIDSAVAELGEKWMPLPQEARSHYESLVGIDARAALRLVEANSLDCVLLDAYANQFEIPTHLASIEFFREVASRLRVGGVFAMNVGAPGTGETTHFLLDALRGSLGVAFDGNVRVQRVPWSRNWVLFARRNQPLPSLPELAQLLPSGLPASLGAACLPGQVKDGAPRTFHFLFDHSNPLISIQLKAWWEAVS